MKMGWYEVSKCLVWVWNCRNQNGEYVYSGKYTCYFEIEETTPFLYPNGGGPIITKNLSVEIIGNDNPNPDPTSDSCGGCGTSSELAFIPPIGFKVASMVKRRKKWWYKLLKKIKI